MSRHLVVRLCVLIPALVLLACSVDALRAQDCEPASALAPIAADPLAALRLEEPFKLLKDLAAAHNHPGLLPPRTSASVLRQQLPGGLRSRIEISRWTNFSLSMNEDTGEIFYPAGWEAGAESLTVDCTGTATITVLARELSRRETGLGDLNCDGVLDGADVAAMALALVDPDAYAIAYPLCNPLNGDLVLDGALDGRDINSFVEHLLAPIAADVPVRLRYRLDAGPYQDLMAGQDVALDDSDAATLTAGAELILSARLAFPGFDAPVLTREVLTDSETSALILVNGDNYNTLAAAKGVQPPYGSQLSIPAILSQYINSQTGLVTLPSNQILVLYELGTANPASPAFDFNDLILKITSSCAVGQEIVLRDSIGSDNSSTNGNLAWSNYRMTQHAAFYMTPITVIPQQSMVLRRYRVIVTRQGYNQIDWASQYFQLRVWTSMQALLSNPTFGNVANVALPSASPAPPIFGQTGMSSLGIRNTHELSFDLLTFNLQLAAGQSYVIGFEAKTINGTYGLLGTMESTEPGICDTQVGTTGTPPPTSWPTTDLGIHRHSGRYAIELRGVVN